MTTTDTSTERPGRPRGLRRRLARHYLPLGAATAGALLVLLSVPFFDANRYPPPGDIFSEGAKGALPDGDYPPTGPPPGVARGTADVTGNEHGGAGTPASAPSAPPGRHTRPLGGGHGLGGPAPTTPPTTSPPSAASPDTAPPTTGRGGTGASATISNDHAGDLDTVLRMRRLSIMTGYLAVGLIALTLLLGPLNLLLRRRQPVSSYLRRDIGIWAGGATVAHVVFGFLVKHADGQILSYFFQAGDRSRILTNAFGLANWGGLAALVIAVGLTAISSDAALRKLKARRWKRLQRWNYALATLTVVHAVMYGALWRLDSPYTVMLIVAVAVVVIAQGTGVGLWRRGRRPAA